MVGHLPTLAFKVTELTIEADEVQLIRHVARQWGDRFCLYREVWTEQLGNVMADKLLVAYALNFHKPPLSPTLAEQTKAMKAVMDSVLNPESDDES